MIIFYSHQINAFKLNKTNTPQGKAIRIWKVVAWTQPTDFLHKNQKIKTHVIGVMWYLAVHANMAKKQKLDWQTMHSGCIV